MHSEPPKVNMQLCLSPPTPSLGIVITKETVDLQPGTIVLCLGITTTETVVLIITEILDKTLVTIQGHRITGETPILVLIGTNQTTNFEETTTGVRITTVGGVDVAELMQLKPITIVRVFLTTLNTALTLHPTTRPSKI